MNTSSNRCAPHALLAVVGLLLLASGWAIAQSVGGPYTLDRQRTAGGGGRSGGGAYELVGTIGQHEASDLRRGASYELSGGFHRRGTSTAPVAAIFRDGFEGL